MVYWTAYPEHLSILWFYDCLYDHKLLPLNQYHEAICPQSWNYVFYWIYIILKSNSISQIKTCQRSFVFGFLVITHYSFLTQKFQRIISLNLCLLEIRDHQSLKLNFYITILAPETKEQHHQQQILPSDVLRRERK